MAGPGLQRQLKKLRAAPVRYFVDPSLGPAALGVGSAELLADLGAAGFHFEALVVRDLRVYAQPLDGVVDAWRDANGREVDAVITLLGGRWGAFEIKLNPTAVDEAASSLVRFAAAVDASRHGEPAVLGVITVEVDLGHRHPDARGVGLDVGHDPHLTRPYDLVLVEEEYGYAGRGDQLIDLRPVEMSKVCLAEWLRPPAQPTRREAKSAEG